MSMDFKNSLGQRGIHLPTALRRDPRLSLQQGQTDIPFTLKEDDIVERNAGQELQLATFESRCSTEELAALDKDVRRAHAQALRRDPRHGTTLLPVNDHWADSLVR